MQFTMFVTGDAIQINLTPENDHEKRFMQILESTEGQVSLSKGADIGMCQGGYVRSFGESTKSVCLTIAKPTQKVN